MENWKRRSSKSSREHVRLGGWYVNDISRSQDVDTTVGINKTFSLQRYPEESLPFQASQVMLKASNEERGTVASLAALSEELDDANDDGMFSHQISFCSFNVNIYDQLRGHML
jgi:hypothetical protein